MEVTDTPKFRTFYAVINQPLYSLPVPGKPFSVSVPVGSRLLFTGKTSVIGQPDGTSCKLYEIEYGIPDDDDTVYAGLILPICFPNITRLFFSREARV